MDIKRRRPEMKWYYSDDWQEVLLQVKGLKIFVIVKRQAKIVILWKWALAVDSITVAVFVPLLLATCVCKYLIWICILAILSNI